MFLMAVLPQAISLASSSGAPLPAVVRPVPPFSVLESQAQRNLSQNRIAAAIEELKAYGPAAARLTGPQFGQYNYIYAGALRAAKKFYESVGRYRLAYLFMPEGQPREMALLDMADVYAGMGFYPEAASAYKIFLNAYGKSDLAWRAHLGLADMLFRARHYRQALQNYEQAGSGAPAQFGKAEALLDCGNPKMAFALFTSLAAGQPEYMKGSALARYSFGEACRLLDRTGQAKTYLGSLTTGQFSCRSAYSLGLIAEGEGDFNLAAGLFQKASGSTDTETRLQALVALARCCVNLGRPDGALAAIGKTANTRPYGDVYWKGQLLAAQAMAMKGEYVRPAAVLKGLLVKKAYARAAMGQLQGLLRGAVAHAVSTQKLVEFWRSTSDCLMQRGQAEPVFKAGEILKAAGVTDFVDIDRWVARNGDAKLRRLAAANLAVYYANEGDGQDAALFFSKAEFALNESTRRLRANIRCLNGDYRGALADLLSIKEKDLSGADLLLLARVLPHVRDARPVGLVEKMVQERKTAVPAGLYLALADAVYGIAGKGQKAKALELYKEAAAGSGTAPNLSPADLEWALFRIQSMAKDPMNSLSALEKQGGLMGRYAQARIEEEKLEQ